MKIVTYLRCPSALGLVLAVLQPFCASAQVKNYRDIRYPALAKFSIPKPEVYTLPNGLQVYLLEDHELPLIEVTVRIRTGSNFEPADKAGLASLMGAVQRTGGTARQTGDQIDDFLAARAASIETGIGEDSGSAGMNCLKQDFTEVFAVFRDILRTPAFAQDKLDVAKVAENTAIARRNDSIGDITEREITRLVYGPDSPLSRQTEYATIAAITREDLVAWHKKYYLPNRMMLGVVGDFQTAAMKKEIEAVFGDWAKGDDFALPAVAFRKDPAPGYYFIEKSDVNQSDIAFGELGIETKNPDYFAVQVMNEVLGGGFGSRMFSNVRSKKGLAYSVYGSIGSSYTHPGMFRAGLQTKSSTTIKGLEAVKAEITGIISQPATEDEIKRAKDSILNSFIFNYDSKGKVLRQQMTYAYYGLPADFLEQYRANIEKVGRADVERVAKKYVHPDQLAVLVVGKATDFDAPLTTLGKVSPVDITIPAPADTTPKAEKNAASIAAGRETWARVVKAMGGDAFKKATGLKSAVKVGIKMGGQEMALSQETLVVFPDKVRQVIVTPIGNQEIVINGDDGFMKMGEKVQPLPAAQVQEQAREQNRNLVYLLHNYDDPGLELVAAGEEKIAGANYTMLVASLKNAESRFWVATDGTVLKQTYQGMNPLTRAPGKVENTFSDFRPESGVVLPHSQVRSIDGEQVMTIKLESLELNPKVGPDIFKKPN